MVWHTHDTLQTVNIDQVIRGVRGEERLGMEKIGRAKSLGRAEDWRKESVYVSEGECWGRRGGGC